MRSCVTGRFVADKMISDARSSISTARIDRVMSLTKNAMLMTFFLMLPCAAMAAPRPAIGCSALRIFATSLKWNEFGQIVLHASWSSNLSNASAPEHETCKYHGSTRGKAVCDYLITHDKFQLMRDSAKWALECLSPGTLLASNVRIGTATFFFPYGNKKHGSDVAIIYDYQEYDAGVSVDLILEANGY